MGKICKYKSDTDLYQVGVQEHTMRNALYYCLTHMYSRKIFSFSYGNFDKIILSSLWGDLSKFLFNFLIFVRYVLIAEKKSENGFVKQNSFSLRQEMPRKHSTYDVECGFWYPDIQLHFPGIYLCILEKIWIKGYISSWKSFRSVKMRFTAKMLENI